MARYNSAQASNSISGATTIGSPYSGSFTNLTGSAPYTVTLPNPVTFPGTNQTFYNVTSGTVTLSTPSGAFSGTGGSSAGTILVYAGNVLSVTSDGTNYVVISEDGSALTATSGTFSGVLTVQASGGVSIAPSSAGTIDNVAIGASARSSGAFTTLTANGALTTTANISSSSTTTGSLVVTGGIGVTGSIYAGSTVSATSLTATNVTGTLQTAAQANITSTGGLTAPQLILAPSPVNSAGIIRRSAISGSNGIRIQGNTVDAVPNDTNAGAYITVGGGIIGDTFEGNIDIVAYGGNVDANRNQIRFSNRSGTDTVTERVRIDKDGNVGIGTTSPGTRLEIYKSLASTTTAQQMLIINTDYASGIGTGFGGSIVFRGRTAGNVLQDNAQILGYNEDTNDNGYALGFFTRPTVGAGMVQRMTILRGGNVGIGANPSAKLHVVASTPSGLGGLPSNSTVVLDSSGSNYITFRNSADNSTQAGMVFQDNNVGGFVVFKNYTGTVATGSDSMLYGTYQDHIFLNGSSETVGYGGKTETLRITSGGNVTMTGTGTLTTGTSGVSIPNAYSYNMSGSYSGGTYYNITDTGTMTLAGVYICLIYADYYAAGQAIYYSTAATVPFYWWGVSGSNNNTANNLPVAYGTGHAWNGQSPPTIRLQQEFGLNGARTYIQFDPLYNLTGINGTGGKTLTFSFRRIA